MSISKDQFIKALWVNWNYPQSVFEEVYEVAETVDIALEFMEYYDGVDQDLGTVEEFYNDFMEIY